MSTPSSSIELTPSEEVYLEELKYLKSISDDQRLLSRAESLVERSYKTVQECEVLETRCKKEIEILQNEKKRLLDRVKAIDSDLNELAAVCTALEEESSVQCTAASLSDYSSLLTAVNSKRSIGQLPPFKECCAYLQLKNRSAIGSRSSTGRKRSTSEVRLISREVKAGKSHKQCPGCFQQVSRNATSCPHCQSPCAKFGRHR